MSHSLDNQARCSSVPRHRLAGFGKLNRSRTIAIARFGPILTKVSGNAANRLRHSTSAPIVGGRFITGIRAPGGGRVANIRWCNAGFRSFVIGAKIAPPACISDTIPSHRKSLANDSQAQPGCASTSRRDRMSFDASSCHPTTFPCNIGRVSCQAGTQSGGGFQYSKVLLSPF